MRRSSSERDRRNPPRFCLALAAALAAMPCARATEVRVQRIDGTSLGGEWRGLEPSGGRALLLHSGVDQRAVQLADVASVSVGPDRAGAFRAEDDAGTPPTVFHLADGGKIRGRITGWDDDTLITRTLVSEETRFPIDRLSAIQWGGHDDSVRAAELFRAALGDRLPGQDVVVTAEADEPKVLRGRVTRVEPESGSFVMGGQTRTFPTDKVYGIVFAAGPAKTPRAEAFLELSDGSSVGGRVVEAGAASVRMETSFGLSKEFDLDLIRRIEFFSDRVVYLSDLEPVESRMEGRLHGSWPTQRDRCVNGGPIALEGRMFEKGLGVHSFCEISYALEPGFESFVATIGLDDAVRPRGSVRFRVLGDGATLFESALLTGRDDPRDVLIPIASVRRLTLVVDYGDELDLSDYADWGGARLLRASVQ